MSDGFEVVDSRQEYEGAIISLFLDKVRFPGGKVFEREVVRHVPVVAVVPVTDSNEVIMVEQYRHPVGRDVLEIPAGLMIDDEEPAACAARELEEETGVSARSIEKIGEFYTTPGFSDERVHLFVATGLTDGDKQPHEDEILETVRVPLSQAVEMALAGRIEDSKTLIGVLIAHLTLRR